MNLKDLRYLIAVADHKHFGKAAEACFVSQPTLSAQIKKLEDTLGVNLIERNNKNVFITSEGEKIINMARHIIDDCDTLKEFAATCKNPCAGTLRIGTIPTIAPYLLPLLMPKIAELMPELKPLLFEDQTHRIVDQIENGQLDVLILAVPVDTGSLVVQELFHEPFQLAAPADHPLLKKKALNLPDIEEEKILLLEEGHCLRDHAMEFCSTSKSDEELAFRATSLETLRQMVASKAGVSMFPELAVKNKNVIFNSELIQYRPFDDHQIGRNIAIAWRKSSVKTEAIKKLANAVLNVVPQMWSLHQK